MRRRIGARWQPNYRIVCALSGGARKVVVAGIALGGSQLAPLEPFKWLALCCAVLRFVRPCLLLAGSRAASIGRRQPLTYPPLPPPPPPPPPPLPLAGPTCCRPLEQRAGARLQLPLHDSSSPLGRPIHARGRASGRRAARATRTRPPAAGATL